VNNFVAKMKRSAGHQIQDKSLKRLIDIGLPELRKGNTGMQSSPHVYDTNHEPAPITVEMEEIRFPETLFTVHDENEQSFLLKKLGRNDSFAYQTESEIQYLVQLALEDALESLGLTDFVGVKPEISVFAYRPDIIVVFHSKRGIILVVKVKKPGIEVFTSHDVGGQIYDYLVGLLGTGIRPFGVLSSYDETCIAYLSDGGVSKEILERVTSQLESEIPEGRVLGNAKPQATSDSGSPASKLRRVLTGPKGTPTSDVSLETEEEDDDEDAQEDGHDDSVEIAVDDDDSEGDPTYNREVMYTPTFSGRDAIKGLILAVRCAIESLNVRVSEEKDVPLNGGGATGACALVNETGLFWTNLPSAVNFEYHNFPASSSKLFYLWKDLGRGEQRSGVLGLQFSGKGLCSQVFFFLSKHCCTAKKILQRQGKQSAKDKW
jgi:hypothetical protein